MITTVLFLVMFVGLIYVTYLYSQAKAAYHNEVEERKKERAHMWEQAEKIKIDLARIQGAFDETKRLLREAKNEYSQKGLEDRDISSDGERGTERQ